LQFSFRAGYVRPCRKIATVSFLRNIFPGEKMANFLNKFRTFCGIRNISNLSTNVHAFTCDVVVPKPTKLVDAWIENIDKIEEEKCGLIELHPQIFRTTPRIDIGNLDKNTTF
jgi:hypothetical protein